MVNSLEQMLKDIERLPAEKHVCMIHNALKESMPKMTALYGKEGIYRLTMVMLAAVSIDGKLTQSEYIIISPFLTHILEREPTYERAKALIKRQEFKKGDEAAELIIKDALGRDETLGITLFLIAALVCGIDGDVCRKGRKWLLDMLD